MNVHHALSFARLCSIAYNRDVAQVTKELQMRDFAAPMLFDVGETQCMVLRGNKVGVLVFRGTEFSLGIAEDIRANFVGEYTDGIDASKPYMHFGYTNALWKALPELLGACKSQLIGVPIYATGHSLGGVLATLFARFYPVSEVYTFGAPCPGNAAFWQEYSTPIWRVVNDEDFAPCFPMRDPFVQSPFCVDVSDGKVKYVNTRRKRFLESAVKLFLYGTKPHDIETYIGLLEKAAQG